MISKNTQISLVILTQVIVCTPQSQLALLNHTSHDDDDLKPLLQSVSQCVVHDISSTATDLGTMLLENEVIKMRNLLSLHSLPQSMTDDVGLDI